MYFTPCMPCPWGMNTANAHNHRTPCCVETQMVQRLGSKPMCLGRGPHRPLGSLLPTHISCLSSLFLTPLPRDLCLGEPTEDLLPPLASSPGSPGSVYLGRNLGHNLSSPLSYLEGDRRMPGEAFSHPTALENRGYLYPVSWQPPLSRIGQKSTGPGAVGPGVLVPACPRTEHYAAHVPVCPLM